MSERPINTNDLREYAYTVPDRCKYLFAVAAELDATRTERNIACRALDAMVEENARMKEALQAIVDNADQPVEKRNDRSAAHRQDQLAAAPALCPTVGR